MTKALKLIDILTEYDAGITGELNLDPLGQQVIWSAYGQAIFRQRISSISNDVRNYTLNLFNHTVTKALLEDEEVTLAVGRRKGQADALQTKESMAFKQACLIYLENVYTYAMVEAQQQEGVETSGVLGISIARRSWQESKSNPKLLFSHLPAAHILVRQNSLGVSGRYKTPLVKMEFFDGNYDYSLPEYQSLWQKAQKQLLGDSTPLAKLKIAAVNHLKDLLNGELPSSHEFEVVPKGLREAFVGAFSSSKGVGKYAEKFWLDVTELDKNAAGALYYELNTKQADPKRSAKDVFKAAAGQPNLIAAEKDKLDYVSTLEPFLGELDLLFNTMLTSKSQTLDEVVTKWEALGRNQHTLRELADSISSNLGMLTQISGTTSQRLQNLLDLSRIDDVKKQAKGLFSYHEKIMQARGQSPWLRLAADGSELTVDVSTRKLPSEEDRPVGAWVNHYYIPQFRNFISGLKGQE